MDRKWMLAAVILAGPSAVAEQRKAPPDVTIYIRASQPAATYLATSEASAMFRSIGVEVAWVAGKPKHPTPGMYIEVNLAVDTPARLKPDALAESHPYAGAAKAITVFYDRVLRRTEEAGVPERKLLAHVLVHEITHVLEGIDRHSDSGVMKAHWTAADYAIMARRPLGFDADDLYWIHQHLEKQSATISRPKGAAN